MTPAKLDGDYLYPANPVQAALFIDHACEWPYEDGWMNEMKLCAEDIEEWRLPRFSRSTVRALIDEAIEAGDVVRVIRPTMRDNHDSIGTEEVIIKIPLPALILGGSVEGALRVMEWCKEPKTKPSSRQIVYALLQMPYYKIVDIGADKLGLFKKDDDIPSELAALVKLVVEGAKEQGKVDRVMEWVR